MPEVFNRILGIAVPFGLNLLSAIIIFFVGRWVARSVAHLAQGAMNRAKVNLTLASFMKNIIYYGILVFVSLAALNNLGIQTTSFVALIGAVGFAVGLALQGSLSNFASGVLLILFHYFDVGDTVEAGGASGVVTDMQIFNTVFLTEDKKTVIVPNAKITGDKIVIIARK